MYSWENIRPGAWLQVVVQSKHRSDGEQPQPYLPFLRVQSGTFYNLSLCPGSLEITVKEPHQGGWGVYVQPLAWEGARLIVAGKSFLSFCFFRRHFKRFFSLNLRFFLPGSTAAARLNTSLACLFEAKLHSTFYVQSSGHLGLSAPGRPKVGDKRAGGSGNGESLWWGVKTLPFNGASWAPKGWRMV